LIRYETKISWGFSHLINIFFRANNLQVNCEERFITNQRQQITLSYEENSDTAYQITLMSVKHLGFENMLFDYLKRCGIPLELIPVGQTAENRDMKKLDQEWEEYRKTLGLQ
jgi:hypothetical protein